MFFSGFLNFPIIMGPYVPTVPGPMLLVGSNEDAVVAAFLLVAGGTFLVLTR